jgi:hypothetical protein
LDPEISASGNGTAAKQGGNENWFIARIPAIADAQTN